MRRIFPEQQGWSERRTGDRWKGNLLTIAPAVEYNFNQHVGLIALFDEQSGTGATTLAVVKKMRLPSWDAGFHIGVFAHDVGHFPQAPATPRQG